MRAAAIRLRKTVRVPHMRLTQQLLRVTHMPMLDTKTCSLRICIAGSPRAGKTTLAGLLGQHYGLEPLHTDDLIPLGWSNDSAAAMKWFGLPGFIVEGCAVPRALRKWMKAHRTGKPCDVVLWLPRPFGALTDGQATMAKGCLTVWSGIEAELRKRGVVVLNDRDALLALRGAA